jgi:L-ascorbate metabolism protein UlaG (beta-lactamase superfamily)
MKARDEIIRAFDDSRLEELADLHARRPMRRRNSLLLRWAAGWLRPPARAMAEPLPDVEDGEIGISFAGHATVLLRTASQAIVCDPMLGGHIGMIRRAVEPGLSPSELADAGLILISHGHVDHLHRPTLEQLPTSATVVVPRKCGELVEKLGFARIVELALAQKLEHDGIEVIATPVKHATRDGRGAVGYVVRGDGPTIFFCGDSGYFAGFREIGRRFHPDIALLPIGGYLPSSFRERHMSPLDAIYAFEDLGARMLIPIHHGAFALSYETLDDPLHWFRELVVKRGLEPWVTILSAGQSRAFR